MSGDQTDDERHPPKPAAVAGDTASGLVVGGRGGPEDQLLNDGQEEVFSRAEVELGRIEHKSEAGGDRRDAQPFGRPS